jgi:hypothetical protein
MTFKTFVLIDGKPTISKAVGADKDYSLKLGAWLKVFSGKLTDAQAVGDGLTVTGTEIVDDVTIRFWASGGVLGETASVLITFTAIGIDGKERTDTARLYFTIE